MAPVDDDTAKAPGAPRPKRSETPPPASRGAPRNTVAADEELRQRKGASPADAAGTSTKGTAAASLSQADVDKDKGVARKGLWSSYVAALGTNPLRTKAATAATISAVGNVGCQLFFESSEILDVNRVLLFVFINIIYVAPVLHFYFGFLSKLIPVPGLLGACLRMLPDQLLWSPVFNFGFLLVLQTLSNGALSIPSLEEVKAVVVAGWKLWPMANTLIFWLVPLDLQLPAGSVVNLFWSVYLSKIVA